MTQAGTAQLTGQLYCIRTHVARKIVLPRDLLVEDGFIKTVVCTDFLRRPSSASRIVRAENASHIFQAYASVRDILKNQKRQMIGQTITHVLVDNYLAQLPDTAKTHLSRFVQKKEAAEPLWLKQLIAEHVRATRYSWELFPGALRFRFKRLARLSVAQWLRHLPATVAGFVVTLLACRAARRCLMNGYLDYWPDTKSRGLGGLIPLTPRGKSAERVQRQNVATDAPEPTPNPSHEGSEASDTRTASSPPARGQGWVGSWETGKRGGPIRTTFEAGGR
jgi:hypothetical protein